MQGLGKQAFHNMILCANINLDDCPVRRHEPTKLKAALFRVGDVLEPLLWNSQAKLRASHSNVAAASPQAGQAPTWFKQSTCVTKAPCKTMS